MGFYTQDYPEKEQIVSLYSSVDTVLAGHSGMRFPINIFDFYAGHAAFDDPTTEAHCLNKSTVILTGNSLPTMCLPGFSDAPHLHSKGTDRRRQKLFVDLDLDQKRRHACVYCRKPGYNNRTPHPLRDIMVSDFSQINSVTKLLI